MSWLLFGSSETSRHLDQITQTLASKTPFESVSTVSETVDETHRDQLQKSISATLTQFLTYYPNLKELTEKINQNAIEIATKKAKADEEATKKAEECQFITQLLEKSGDSIAFSQFQLTEETIRLLLSTHSLDQLENYASRLDQFKNNSKLATRSLEVIKQVDGQSEAEWIQTLMKPGILNHEQSQKLMETLVVSTTTYLSTLSEENLREMLVNLSNRNQITELSVDRQSDLRHLRQKSAVKANIISIENHCKNPPIKSTQIITTRPVTIPNSFVKKMAEINSQKLSEAEGPASEISDRICVRETYSNGQQRLKGTRCASGRLGTWVWWNSQGEQIADYNYTTNAWNYLKSSGRGPVTYFQNEMNDVSQSPEFSYWIHEARDYQN
jgi:type II secretory pathway component PulM